MKKTLVALAALAAVGAASAQSSVTLYGHAGVNIVSKSAKSAAGVTTDPGVQMNSGGQSGSRWGMKGTEDLGGGMKANFKLESGIANNTGVSTGFNRNSWVSLSGGFGEVSAGLQWTPYDSAFYSVDSQYYASFSVQPAVFGGGMNGIGTHADTGNQPNSLMYTSPDMGGFGGSLMYVMPGGSGAAPAAGTYFRYTGLGLHYTNGPIDVEFGGENFKVVGDVTTSNAWILGGSYDFGPAKVNASYERASGPRGVDKGYSLGVAAPLSPAATLIAAYAREETTGAAVNGVTSGWGLNLNYSLSKRTMVYVAANWLTSKVAGAPTSATARQFGGGLRVLF